MALEGNVRTDLMTRVGNVARKRAARYTSRDDVKRAARKYRRIEARHIIVSQMEDCTV